MNCTEPVQIPVTALVRELVVASPHWTGTYKDAEKLSAAFDALIVNADSLATLNGTTFEREFDPLKLQEAHHAKT